MATKATETVPETRARWIASKRGSVYYRIGCSGANGLEVENRVFFKTEKEAEQAGYTRSRTKGC